MEGYMVFGPIVGSDCSSYYSSPPEILNSTPNASSGGKTARNCMQQYKQELQNGSRHSWPYLSPSCGCHHKPLEEKNKTQVPATDRKQDREGAAPFHSSSNPICYVCIIRSSDFTTILITAVKWSRSFVVPSACSWYL